MNQRKLVEIKTRLAEVSEDTHDDTDQAKLFAEDIRYLLKELESQDNKTRNLRKWKELILAQSEDRLWIDADAQWYQRSEDGDTIVPAKPPAKFLKMLWQQIKKASNAK